MGKLGRWVVVLRLLRRVFCSDALGGPGAGEARWPSAGVGIAAAEGTGVVVSRRG